MIDRIPLKMVPPLIGLRQASARISQPPHTISRFRHLLRHSRRCTTRMYASPPTSNFRAPHPTDPPFAQQGPHSPQPHELPRYFPPPEPQIPSPPPRARRSLRPYIYALIFTVIGAASGRLIANTISPAEAPLPGSPEDMVSTARIHLRAASLPLVQALSADGEWRSWDAYSAFSAEEKRHRMTSGPLAGSRALGAYQRIFHNPRTGEFVAVVWIGGALAGWPTVAHGGLTATLLDEGMGRCAIARFPVQTGVTAYLDFNFVKPVRTRNFYVVRANPITERSTERKGFVKGRLESLDGEALVLVEGLFVLPKNLPSSALKPIELSNSDVGF